MASTGWYIGMGVAVLLITAKWSARIWRWRRTNTMEQGRRREQQKRIDEESERQKKEAEMMKYFESESLTDD